MLVQSVRRNVAWSAIPIAGIAGGIVYLVSNFILMPLLLKSSGLLFLRYAGSLIMGENAVMDGGAGVIVAGLIVHFVMSILLAFVIGIVVHRWGMRVGIVLGALLGLAFYAINLFFFTRYFPWYFAINGPVLLIGHVLFGAVAGGVYEALDRFDVEGQL